MRKLQLTTSILSVLALSACSTIDDRVLSENPEYYTPAKTRNINNEEVVTTGNPLSCFADGKPVMIEGYLIPRTTLNFSPGKDFHGIGRKAQVGEGPFFPERLDVMARKAYMETKLFQIEEITDVDNRISVKRLAKYNEDFAPLKLANFKVSIDASYLQWNGGKSTLVSLAGATLTEDMMDLDVSLTQRVEYQYTNKNILLHTATARQSMRNLMSGIDIGTILNSNFAALSHAEKKQIQQAAALYQTVEALTASAAQFVTEKDCYANNIKGSSLMSFKAFVRNLQLNKTNNEYNKKLAIDSQKFKALQESLIQRKLLDFEKAKFESLIDPKNEEALKDFLEKNRSKYPTKFAIEYHLKMIQNDINTINASELAFYQTYVNALDPESLKKEKKELLAQRPADMQEETERLIKSANTQIDLARDAKKELEAKDAPQEEETWHVNNLVNNAAQAHAAATAAQQLLPFEIISLGKSLRAQKIKHTEFSVRANKQEIEAIRHVGDVKYRYHYTVADVKRLFNVTELEKGVPYFRVLSDLSAEKLLPLPQKELSDKGKKRFQELKDKYFATSI